MFAHEICNQNTRRKKKKRKKKRLMSWVCVYVFRCDRRIAMNIIKGFSFKNVSAFVAMLLMLLFCVHEHVVAINFSTVYTLHI